MPRRARRVESQRVVRRFVVILKALTKAAARVVASDVEVKDKGKEGGCVQLPLLAAQLGVALPSKADFMPQSTFYPFRRLGGTVRTWHVWVDRFSIVFSRLLAKLVYQLKILTASLDYSFLQGAGSRLFWGDKTSLTSRSSWHWPHWPPHESENCSKWSSFSSFTYLISNQTSLEVVEATWLSAKAIAEASEGLRVLFLEDSLREPWQTSYRPVFSQHLAHRARQLNKELAERNVSMSVVWRRHQATMSIEDVAAFHLCGQMDYLLDLRRQQVPQQVLRQVPQQVPQGDSEWRAPEFHEVLAPYLDFHSRAVAHFGGGEGHEHFRALVYVCNPLTLCGGHGDRTNGIISAFTLALLTGRAFFIDFDSPLPLSLVFQPQELDWRVKALGAMGHGSQSFYLDDRVSFQEDLSWLVEDSSQILQLSMNHRELSAILVQLLEAFFSPCKLYCKPIALNLLRCF